MNGLMVASFSWRKWGIASLHTRPTVTVIFVARRQEGVSDGIRTDTIVITDASVCPGYPVLTA